MNQLEKRHNNSRPTADRLGFGLLDHCGFGLIVLNSEKRVSFWNTWIEKATGWKKQDVLEKHIEDIFPELENTRITTSIETAFSQNLPSVLTPKLNPVQFPLTRKNSRGEFIDQIEQNISIKPLSDEDGERYCLIEIVDVTAAGKRDSLLRKTSHEARQQRDELAASNREKDHIFSIISHDLRSPLTAMIGLSEMLVEASGTLPIEIVQQYSKGVNEAANGLYKLLENLLEWSLLQMDKIPFEPLPLNPRTLADESVSLLKSYAERKGITLSVEEQRLALINADPKMTAAILRNLISNAIKFTPDGGEVKLLLAEEGEYFSLSVKDNGIGLDVDKLENLFQGDVLTTTKGTEGETGTGLGLPLCHQLVLKQGGTITAKSQIGVGTEFIVRLPLYKETPH